MPRNVDRDVVRDLSPIESWYTSAVQRELRSLPRRMRAQLMSAVQQNLHERRGGGAPEVSMADLERSLGTPAGYAAELLADAERAQPGSVTAARRRHRIWVAVLTVAVLALTGAAGGTFYWWLSFDPHVTDLSLRVCAGAHSDDDCGRDGFVDLYPANMLSVPCSPDRPLFIEVGLMAARGITVTGATIPGVGGVGNPSDSTQMLRLDSVQPWTRPDPSGAPRPADWPIPVGDDAATPEIHFALTTCPTDTDAPRPGAGGATTLFGFELQYRAFGRDRTAIVPFGEALALVVPS